MAGSSELRQRVRYAIDRLPEDALREVAAFIDLQRHKRSQPKGEQDASAPATFQPVRLGGLWKGMSIGDDDIAEARREMWAAFGEKQL
jgi:hypothetical protein